MVYTEDYLKEKLTKELEAEVCEVMYLNSWFIKSYFGFTSENHKSVRILKNFRLKTRAMDAVESSMPWLYQKSLKESVY